MKSKTAPWLVLMIITATAGLLLGLTNAVTAPVIEQRTLAAADESRYLVFPNADGFKAIALTGNPSVDDLYEATLDGQVVGYVGTATVKGYGGEIEVRVGLDEKDNITGIHVGGTNFAESAGLGARTRDPEFTDQFKGASTPVALGKNIDAISGATISSGAVVSGVNKIVKYVANLGKEGGDTDLYNTLLNSDYAELPHDETVEKALKTDTGYAVFTVSRGYHGDIRVVTVLDEAGVVIRIAIDENEFAETAGLGERVLEEQYLAQYIGKAGVIGVNPSAYGTEDATSAATGETEDATSAATGETEDATSAATGETEDATSADTGETADATSAATGETEDTTSAATGETTDATSAATGETADTTSAATGETEDATSAATGETEDGVSSASVEIETIDGADASIDGVSGATVSSTAVTKAVNAAIAFVKSLLAQ